jgi:GNAT superfamily N-acetyltransferase
VTGVVIRERTSGDLAAVVGITAELQVVDGYPSFLGNETLKDFVAPSDVLGAWVATIGDDVVGNVLLRPRSAPASAAMAATALDVPADRILFVARLMVAPRARRRGVARMLLRTVLDEAHRRDRYLVLDVVTKDTAALSLYEAEGWRLLGHHAVTRPEFHVDLAVFAEP